VHRPGAPLGNDLLQVVDEPFTVLEDELLLGAFVLEGDLQPFVKIARNLEPLLDDRRIELDFRKDRRVGMEIDAGAGAPRRTELLESADRLALLEAHLPLRAVALHRRDQLLRQRVDDAGAHAVETAGGLVTAVLEFAAGM
jgi:hypothetical protein